MKLSALLHPDLPIADIGANRFLPLMVAVMVFLAAMTLAGAFAVTGIIDQWDRDVTGTLTVQIPSAEGVDALLGDDPDSDDPDTRSDGAGDAAAAEATGEAESTDARVERAVALLRAHEAVAAVRVIPADRLRALMEPWLGSPDLVADLPIPRLIDVSLRPEASLDLSGLAADLAEVVPGTTIDDHRLWLTKLVDLARGLERLSWAVVLLVTTATSAAVVEATRSGMMTHRSVIEVLHLIGAQDDYIARQFARRAMVLGLVGGLMGLALALPAILGIGYLSRDIEGGFVPDVTLAPLHWVVIAGLPAASGLVAMATTRLTVLRALSNML